MKPDWKDAPEWANWLAMNIGGGWYWFECEPVENSFGFDFSNGLYERAWVFTQEWRSTKEPRP